MNVLSQVVLFGFLALGVNACSDSDPADPSGGPVANDRMALPENALPDSNPFASPSPLQFGYPPFDRIESSHFLPAFERGMEEQLVEIEAIARQSAPPSFTNTLVPLERSGRLLHRVSAVFDNLVATRGDADLLALQQRLLPRLASHDYQIVHNPALFQRIALLYQQRDTLDLDAESLSLLERYYADFVSSGAALVQAEQAALVEIDIELEYLQTLYSENSVDQAAALASQLWLQRFDRETLQSTSMQQVLVEISDRGLRQQIHLASISRGYTDDEYDNRSLLQRVLQLRAQKARLLGYANYAEYALARQSAGTLETVDNVLTPLAAAAVAAVQREAEILQASISREGEEIELAAWDWDFYRSQPQAANAEEGGSDFDYSVYLSVDQVLEKGVFFAAERLYGISFSPRNDLPVYHADVQVFEVFDAVGSSLGLLVTDLYARGGKRSGAWTNVYVTQSGLLRDQTVVGVQFNFEKPVDGGVTLLDFAEVGILFHEFGHVLQALFSNVEYPYFSANRVAEDFLEFPGLLNEMWAVAPEVMDSYARHYVTGEPLPNPQREALTTANTFNNGFTTTEYLAAAVLDLALHRLAPDQIPTPGQLAGFEQQTLALAGLDLELVPPRYRSTYFLHLMGGFAAGYYTYLWADMLDADARQWFADNGGLERKNGDHFRQTVLSRGGTSGGMELINDFLGREVTIQSLIDRRGLNQGNYLIGSEPQ